MHKILRSLAVLLALTYAFPAWATRDILTTPTGSNQTYTSNATWNNSNNTVECIGAGASGGSTQNAATSVAASGGGGGAYSKITNFTFATPGTTTATWQTGTGGAGINPTVGSSVINTNGNSGGSTWFNASADPGNGADNTKCSAQGGAFGTTGANAAGGAGGATTSSWGTTKNGGGRGGTISASATRAATGGGGAGGPNGAGNTGVDLSTSSAASAGGQGDSTSGGTGSSGSTASGTSASAGNAGTEYTTAGSGGGGGAMSCGANASNSSGAGGNYGAGSGGSLNVGSGNHGSVQAKTGAGAGGLIVVTWTPAISAKSKGYIMGSEDFGHIYTEYGVRPYEAMSAVRYSIARYQGNFYKALATFRPLGVKQTCDPFLKNAG